MTAIDWLRNIKKMDWYFIKVKIYIGVVGVNELVFKPQSLISRIRALN